MTSAIVHRHFYMFRQTAVPALKLALTQMLEFFKTILISNAFSVLQIVMFATEVWIPNAQNARLVFSSDLLLIHVNHVTFLIVSHVVSQ